MTHSNSNPSSLPKRILSQFATYRNAITRVAWITTFLVISFLACLPEVSRAQAPVSCPSGYTGGPYEIISTISSGCEIGIWYCDSSYAGGDSDKRYIEQIDLLNDSCDYVSYGSIVQQAGVIVMGDASGVPSCAESTVYIRVVYQADCWAPFIPVGLPVHLTPCETMSELGFCIYTCALCRDPTTGLITPYNCGYTTDGFTPDCGNLTDPWVPGHCHIVNCGGD